MKKITSIAYGISLLGASYLSSAQEHQAAPMLAEPRQHAPAPAPQDNQRLVGEFRSAYSQAGEPRIAIFWNRKFSDQLSQWEALERRTIAGESAGNLKDVFNQTNGASPEDALGTAVGSLDSGTPSGGNLGSYERNVTGGSRILASEYYETRIHQRKRAGMGESTDFEFGSGYTQAFLSASAKIIDRQAIMRLIERDNARAAGAEMVADYQKVETDALIGYADYLAEIVFVDDPGAALGKAFMVSVKEVATGRVVAMFRSEGTPQNKPVPKAEWVATASGFQKVQAAQVHTPIEVGEQLGMETMEALARIW